MTHRPALSLVVTTFQRADALRAVLHTVLAQRQAPLEVLIADDGSTDATAEVIRAASQHSAVPLRHLWHPHEGFRLTCVRNRAIAAARGDYLVFVDGDMLLHPEFVADHGRLARRGCYTQGVRVLLDRTQTEAFTQDPRHLPGCASPGLGGLRRLYAWHAPRAAVALRTLANNIIAIKGCNQAFWRDDLLAINGFNEDIVGWGPEDKELCARLGFRGIARQSLLFGGIAFHLHHPPAARERRAANEEILARTLASRAVRCANGLDRHLAAPP